MNSSANIHQIKHRINTEEEQNYDFVASEDHRTVIGG
jgi:hypothetical protein